MADLVTFFLNGQRVTLENPSTETVLIDYLRSPDVHLAGPKKPCGQGGCGGCTVILSAWNDTDKRPEHRAINACLRPIASLNGYVITTVEGTGAARRPNPKYPAHNLTFSRTAVAHDAHLQPVIAQSQRQTEQKRAEVTENVRQALADSDTPSFALRTDTPSLPSQLSHQGINPVAHRLAINNGTQCGYCTVGFVMNMSEFIANNPQATKREIEGIFDGNICRCTGYRPILTGMKTFASDWTKEDEKHRMRCYGDDAVQSQRPADSVVIPFPDEAQVAVSGVAIDDGRRRWRTPRTLSELTDLLIEYRDDKPFLVCSNTAYGIYKEEFLTTTVLLDIRLVAELNAAPVLTDQEIRFSAGISYTDLIGVLEQQQAVGCRPGQDPETTAWGAACFMARRTAGRIVRNAASLGGNAMLVLKHIQTPNEAPFPSDLFTALAGIGAQIEYVDVSAEPAYQLRRSSVDELVARVVATPELARQLILVAFYLPVGQPDDIVLAQKVALRDVNAHSIVNATTRLTLSEDLRVLDARLVFGGIAPYPWRATATEARMTGQLLSTALVTELVTTLDDEVKAELQRWAPRMKDLPTEGFTEAYRVDLATAFLYKAVVNALTQRGAPIRKTIRSAGDIKWGRWPVSDGRQVYKKLNYRAPVGQPYIKFTAMEQASGQLHYTHELAVPPNTLNGAFVQSERAVANFHFVVPGQANPATTDQLRHYLAERFSSFVDLITHEAFQDGRVNFQGMGLDQPILAKKQVNYVGQSIALVLADTELNAGLIADHVTAACVAYTQVDIPEGGQSWWNKPVLSLEQAISLNSIYPDWPTNASYNSHIWRITRPGSQLDWITDKPPLDKEIVSRSAVIDGVSCQIVEATQITGGQAHFYMEPQAAIVEPMDGKRMLVRPSTQSPMEMHNTVAMALNVQYNSLDVQVPPVGGGFGGKTEQARFVVGAAAIAAYATKRPVRLALSREQDTAMIGKRHAYYGQYQIAIDRGDTIPANRGILRGLVNRMWGDGGAFYDCSFIVSNCIMTRADNAYRIANFQAQIDVCRTNTAPSTAMRAFGDIQGKLILENAIDDAAFSVNMRAEEVREKNLYERGDVTPFGQALSYCYIRDVWTYLKEVCRYKDKKREIDAFNKANRWRKRGMSLIPIKYGSGYNLVMLEQASALVSIYQGDGSIIIHQGGAEIGQGLLTQVRQVASYILNVPMSLIQIEAPKTSVIPNPTSTGASTGTTYNAEVVKRVCEELRSRLMEFGYTMLKQYGDEWCKAKQIDFWNYGQRGWRARPKAAAGSTAKPNLLWQNLVALAYQNRVNLMASFNVPMRGGETPVPNITYKAPADQPTIPGYVSDPKGQPGEFDSFPGFTYSAACSVVEVDILTGEVKLISSDLVYDSGWSMNPAIDIGQVEGAFVQGIGYVLSEKLVFEPDGDQAGRLNTLNTWTYKPPATTSIPLTLNVHLFPRDRAGNVPENPSDVLSAKEIGEPPLVLSTTVFFAIKDAIRASRLERGLPGLFQFDAPATVQEVRRACEISPAQLLTD